MSGQSASIPLMIWERSGPRPTTGPTEACRQHGWATDHRQPPDRSAFTLVELLVVIAIIAILISLLMPAIQSAREAARRAQCVNNQKQIALAITSYESSHGRLPPSGLVDPNEDPNLAFGTFNPRSGKMISWAVLVLPQLEEQNLYDLYDLDRTVFDQPKLPQAYHVPTYHCPSDGSEDSFFQHPELTNDIPFAKGNYAAFVSPFHIDEQIWYPGALGGGKWIDQGQQRIGQRMSRVKDGLSKTLMLSEVRTRANPLDQRGAWALPWSGSSLLAADVHPIPVLNGRSQIRPDRTLPYAVWPATLTGAQVPNNRGFNMDMLYDCPEQERAQLEGLPCAIWGDEDSESYYLSAAPRSRHAGGVVAAGMDGHVRFLVDEIDGTVLAYMVSINDGRSRDIPN